jgi:xanthine/uracil permease
MDWMWLVMGVVLGSLVTSALVWAQRGTARSELPPDYLSRVALSVVATSLVAGLGTMALGYASTGVPSLTSVWFGSGWLLGGLLAAWFLSRAMRRP